MEIRIRSNGQVMTEQDFRRMHPNTSFPSVLSAELINSMGADVVLEGPQAICTNQYQYSMRQGVEQIDGKWFTKYVVGPLFTDTVNNSDGNNVLTAPQQETAYKAQKDAEQARAVRATRDKRLKMSDWTQVVDAPLPQSLTLEWQTYRQALRDITVQPGFPWDITWPVAPT